MTRAIPRLLALALLGAAMAFFGWLGGGAPGRLASPPLQIAANVAGQPMVRVLLADAAESGLLSVNGHVEIIAVIPSSEERKGSFTDRKTVRILPTGSGISLGNDNYIRASLRPLDGNPIRVSWTVGGETRSMDLFHEVLLAGSHVSDGGKGQLARIRLLALVPMEEYLYGVLNGEVLADWPLEALMAQAIVARTYALYHVKARAGKEFDLTDRAQEWKPAASYAPRFRSAVDATAGIVLTEQHALFEAFFHSECGGFTADGNDVFGTGPITALSGVRCPRCAPPGGKPRSWTWMISKTELENRLRRAKLLRGGQIRSVVALNADGHPLTARGRVSHFELILESGTHTTVKIPANTFRLAVGADKSEMASTWLSVDSGSGPQIVFSGRGWGHGVGLCQWGAEYAARTLQWKYRDILERYYPGARLVRVWGAPRADSAGAN